MRSRVTRSRLRLSSSRIEEQQRAGSCSSGGTQLSPSDARAKLVLADKATVTVAQPNPNAEIRFEGDDVGVAVPVKGQNAEDALAHAQTQGLAFSRRREMNVGGTPERKKRSWAARAKTVRIETQRYKNSKQNGRSTAREAAEAAGA